MTLRINGRRVLVCNCERTMEVDGRKLAACLGAGETHVHSHLCRSQVDSFERALDEAEPLLVACTQEAPLFRELAQEKGGADLVFANIRETAGWSEARGAALPKMAALLSAAAYQPRPAGSVPIESKGVCLVYGAGQAALEVAQELASRLSVSLLLTDARDVMPPAVHTVPLYKGRIVKASGSLGAFEITVDGYAPAVPSSRDSLAFLMERNGATSKCDLIFDMSGGTPLFPGGSRRDGYFHVDPQHPAAVAKAMFAIADMVGEFEKPIYVAYDPDICAHGRSGKVGCSNCLDACPVSAIAPQGDTVRIDARICGGCGNCSAVCPSGAASYDFPGRADLVARLQALLQAYLAAGGRHPVLLVHDDRHGAPLISAMARYGRGLPANVLPLSVYSTTALGHDVLLAAHAAGAERTIVLAPPDRTGELAALEVQAGLANAFLLGLGYGERVAVLVEADPDAVESVLFELPRLDGAIAHAFAASASKRELVRTALAKLREGAEGELPEVLALPAGAPYGRIVIDTKGCTLCLACVSACPANALADSPDRPQVRFTEAACVQCGLCKVTCPESVISLEPRYNFAASALSPTVLNEEEPFACIRCGKPFGTKSSIERIAARLKGKHWMFQDEEQARIIQMCDDCRIITLSETSKDPFAMGERPRIRTTDDYLRAEEQARATGKSVDDFLN